MRRIRTGIILIRGRWLTHRRIWITGRSRRSRAASSAASAGTATFAGISAAARIFSRIAIVIRIGRKRRFDLFLRISRRPYRGSRRRRRRRIRIRNNCDQSGTAGHRAAHSAMDRQRNGKGSRRIAVDAAARIRPGDRCPHIMPGMIAPALGAASTTRLCPIDSAPLQFSNEKRHVILILINCGGTRHCRHPTAARNIHRGGPHVMTV